MQDNNSQNETSEFSYNPTEEHVQYQQGYPQTAEPVKKKRKAGRIIARIIAGICAVCVISIGSIAGYRYIDDNGLPFLGVEGRGTEKNNDQKHEDLSEAPSSEENKEEEKEAEIDRTRFKDTSVMDITDKKNPMSTQAIYQKVMPSVVGISSTFEYQSTSYSFFSFGDTQTREAVGTGTGIIMSSDGYILTNAHVIYSDGSDESDIHGTAKKVTVKLHDSEDDIEARIVGYDAQADIAVIKIDRDDLTPAEFGDSSKVQVGDSAVAIGNPLGFDLFGTLTVGYISGLGREVAINDTTIKLIQTDAAINSGNSGGPLINECGQVIGINSMKMSRSYYSTEASIEGLAFAIPIDQAKKIIDDLMAYGYVTGRPQLGISYKNLSASAAYYYSGRSATSGVMVTGVNEDGPADKAGIEENDIIVGADEKLVTCMEDLKEIIGEHNAGDSIKLTVIRSGRYYDVSVTLEDNKPDTSE